MRFSLKNIGLGTGAAALVAVGVALLASSSHGVARAPAVVSPPPLPVQVAAVDRQTVPVYLDFVATTEAIRNVTLEAKVTGYLASQPVGDGADVPPGQNCIRSTRAIIRRHLIKRTLKHAVTPPPSSTRASRNTEPQRSPKTDGRRRTRLTRRRVLSINRRRHSPLMRQRSRRRGSIWATPRSGRPSQVASAGALCTRVR